MKHSGEDIPRLIWSHPLLKVLQTLNLLKHLHPHKLLLRSVSGYIFSSRSLTETSLLQYKTSSMLPTTWSVQHLQSKNNNSNNNNSNNNNKNYDNKLK